MWIHHDPTTPDPPAGSLHTVLFQIRSLGVTLDLSFSCNIQHWHDLINSTTYGSVLPSPTHTALSQFMFLHAGWPYFCITTSADLTKWCPASLHPMMPDPTTAQLILFICIGVRVLFLKYPSDHGTRVLMKHLAFSKVQGCFPSQLRLYSRFCRITISIGKLQEDAFFSKGL